MYIKRTCIIGIFINLLIHFLSSFLRINFRIYYFLAFGCFFFLCPLILYTFLVCFFLIPTIIIYHQVLFIFVFILILTKMVTAFKTIITTLWMIYGYFLKAFVFYLKVWFNNRSNIKLRLLAILIVSLLLFLDKHIKTPDHNEAIRSCSKHESFTFDYTDTRENIESLGTQLTINHFSILKPIYKKLNSSSQLLLLLSGYISSNRSSRYTVTFEWMERF